MEQEGENSLPKKNKNSKRTSKVIPNGKQLVETDQSSITAVSWQRKFRERGSKLIDNIAHLIPDIIETLDIRDGTDEKKTKKDITEGVVVKGYNVWILAASALLASIGLDTNSTAVIIGAMLISPLMNPILGVGLGLGINDWELSRKAVYNLGIATGASLLTSLIYFWLTPLGDATPEILARTKPTLLDVGVAIFGGVAGIVSNSRIEKTNAIPGVAIATALMPPLCVSGFGLATLEFSIFFGAFYLFFINAVFISISTFIMVRFFGFEPRERTDKITRRKINYAMLGLSLVVIIPSIVFLLSIINQARTNQKIREIIINPIDDDSRYEMIKWEVAESDTIQVIKLYVSSSEDMQKTEKDSLNQMLRNNGLGDYEINVNRVSVSKKELDAISVKTEEEIATLKQDFKSLNSNFDSLRQAQQDIKDTIFTKREVIMRLQRDLQIFYPALVEINDISGYDFLAKKNDSTQNKGSNNIEDSLERQKEEFYLDGIVLKYGIQSEPNLEVASFDEFIQLYFGELVKMDSTANKIGEMGKNRSKKIADDIHDNIAQATTNDRNDVIVRLIWDNSESQPSPEDKRKIIQYIAQELELEIPHHESDDSTLIETLDKVTLENLLQLEEE